ncbi:MAG: hypothetical protein MZU97_19890 [Bacillus subtilis]|nr:hypothetical protein [Bacillus subtilis]
MNKKAMTPVHCFYFTPSRTFSHGIMPIDACKKLVIMKSNGFVLIQMKELNHQPTRIRSKFKGVRRCGAATTINQRIKVFFI